MSLGSETALLQLCLHTVLAGAPAVCRGEDLSPCFCPACRAGLMHCPSEPRLLTPGWGASAGHPPPQPTSVMRSEQTRVPRVGFKSHVSRPPPSHAVGRPSNLPASVSSSETGASVVPPRVAAGQPVNRGRHRLHTHVLAL